MKQLFFFSMLLFAGLAFGQTPPKKSEAEKAQQEYEKQVQKYLKEQQQLEKEMQEALKDPEIQKAYKNAGMPMHPQASSPMREMQANVKWGKLPAKQTELLASLPKQVMSKEALQAYVTGLKEQVNKKINPSDREYALQFITSTIGDALALSRAAVLAWYKTRPQLALALAVGAAAADPENAEILNTAGAILNLCGLEHKALPILSFLDQQAPGNSTVLNNIGQSYLGLGDLPNAEKYLLMCVAKAPLHTEANKSLGMIYNANGQSAKAKQCFSNSLKGGFSETAYAGAQRSGTKDFSPVYEFISDRYGKPEYFNSYRYNIPQLCENVQDAPAIRLEHLKFSSFLSKQRELYGELAQQGTAKFQQNTQEFYRKVQAGVVPITSPFSKLAARMLMYFEKQYTDASQANLSYQQDYFREKEKIIKTYRQNLKKQDEASKPKWDALSNKEELSEEEVEALRKEDCRDADAVTNQYLFSLANLQRRLASQTVGALKEPLQNIMYWQQFVAPSFYEANVYSHILGYLDAVSVVEHEAEYPFPACYDGPTSDPEEASADSAMAKPDCPFNLGVRFFIGKISMDCEKFGIEVNAGVSFTAEKNFVSKETTLAIGAGLELETGFGMENIPVIGLKGSIGASEQFYIVFDGNNNPSDIGIKLEAGAGASVSGNAGPLGSKIGGTEIKGGYTLGLNSGWTFEGQVPGIKLDLN